MPSLFRLNPGFEKKLTSEARFTDGLAGAAKPAAAAARNFAHRIMPAGKGRNIGVVKDGHKVYIVNLDHGGHLDEFGSRNNPPYAPLRRGVRSAGLRFRGD